MLEIEVEAELFELPHVLILHEVAQLVADVVRVVEGEAVGEDKVHISKEVLRSGICVTLQLGLDRAEIHRGRDYFKVVWV